MTRLTDHRLRNVFSADLPPQPLDVAVLKFCRRAQCLYPNVTVAVMASAESQ